MAASDKQTAKAKKVSGEKASKAKAKAPEHDGYNSVVNVASLESVMLVSSVFEIKPAYFADDGDRELVSDRSRSEFSYDAESGYLTQVVSFTVKAVAGEDAVLECSASYLVAFKLDEEVDEQAAQVFIDRVGLFAAYPYFRSRVSQYSWESGADLPILPVIKSPPRKR